MPGTDDLERRIKERLEVSEESRHLRQNHIQEASKAWSERQAHFTGVADRLMQVVIRPRVEKLKSYFENAMLPEERNTRHTSVCEFANSPRFPAAVRLEFGVTRDGEAKTVIVQYSLAMLPVLVRFQERDQLCVPLEAVAEDQVATWADEKIVGFVDTYLRLETASPTQEENDAVDPVCGMQVNKNQAPASMTHRGQVYYFCREECRVRFAENPGRYLPATGGK
jgi:YHS domain-containing protein